METILNASMELKNFLIELKKKYNLDFDPSVVAGFATGKMIENKGPEFMKEYLNVYITLEMAKLKNN